jgi:hypothetical protein
LFVQFFKIPFGRIFVWLSHHNEIRRKQMKNGT